MIKVITNEHQPVALDISKGLPEVAEALGTLKEQLPRLAAEVESNPEAMRDHSYAEYAMRLPAGLAMDIKAGIITLDTVRQDEFDKLESRAKGVLLAAGSTEVDQDHGASSIAVLQGEMFADRVSAALSEGSAGIAADMLGLYAEVIDQYSNNPSMVRYIYEKSATLARDLSAHKLKREYDAH